MSDYRVPIAPVRELLCAYLERQQAELPAAEYAGKENDVTSSFSKTREDPLTPLSPLVVLAEESGIGYKTLWGYTRTDRRQKTIPWYRVDILLCAMDMPMAWHGKALRRHYWMGDPPPDYENPVNCANPRCNQWFRLNASEEGQGRYRYYCSHNCRIMAGRIGRGEARLDADRCIKGGHLKTPESWKVNPKTGWGRCLTCKAEWYAAKEKAA